MTSFTSYESTETGAVPFKFDDGWMVFDSMNRDEIRVFTRVADTGGGVSASQAAFGRDGHLIERSTLTAGVAS